MRQYEPQEVAPVYGSFKSRLIFYKQVYDEKEEAALQEFRDYCKSLGKPVPNAPAEILRCIY